MIEIMLRSQYDHFTLPQTPKYIKWVNHPTKIQFFSDEFIPLNKNPENSALLIEPHSIQPRIYDYIERNWQDFKYIFTHDGYLLDNIPNTKRILFGGVYEFNDIPKTKDISFCSSRKTMCDLHRRRLDLAYELEKYDIVDCMGTYNGGKYVTTKEIYAPYRFSIIIENWIDDYWFTEKICNCFANKCVPIYYGARRIGEFFDENGIVFADSVDDIYEWVKIMDKYVNLEKWYSNLKPHIDENYERVKQFTCFEDTFYRDYKDLLEAY